MAKWDKGRFETVFGLKVEGSNPGVVFFIQKELSFFFSVFILELSIA